MAASSVVVPLQSVPGFVVVSSHEWPGVMSYGARDLLLKPAAILHTTQTHVSRAVVDEKKRLILEGKELYAEVFPHAGKRWIFDGHHAAVAYKELNRSLPVASYEVGPRDTLIAPPVFSRTRKGNPSRQRWYHGSPIAGLKELKREENPKRMDSAGLWFTTDPDFAADNFGPHLYEAKTAICVKPATLPEDQLYAPWSLYWDLALVRRFASQRVRGFAPGGPPDSWSEARREDAAEVWQTVKFNTSYVRAWRNKQLAEGRKCFLFPDLVGFDGWERRQSILLVLDPPTIAVRQLR